MNRVKNYLSLIKFSHTIFALPFAIIGFSIGVVSLNHTSPTSWLLTNYRLFMLVLCCMFFARSAAMAFNRWADSKYDKANNRTKTREIPSGIISSNSALAFVIINCTLFILCTYFINSICLYLSPIALIVILGYSYTKRFTPLCHLILGVGLSLAPIGAFIAVTGKFAWLPLLFSLTVLLWVSGFDVIYALQDEEFDRAQNLKSIPVLVGKKMALSISRILHSVAALIILFIGYYASFKIWYFTGSGIFILLLIYQQTLVNTNNLSKINLAFFTTNGIASLFFSAFVLIEVFY